MDRFVHAAPQSIIRRHVSGFVDGHGARSDLSLGRRSRKLRESVRASIRHAVHRECAHPRTRGTSPLPIVRPEQGRNDSDTRRTAFQKKSSCLCRPIRRIPTIRDPTMSTSTGARSSTTTHSASFPEFAGPGLSTNVGWLGLQHDPRGRVFPRRLVSRHIANQRLRELRAFGCRRTWSIRWSVTKACSIPRCRSSATSLLEADDCSLSS